ncbi:MAG TPA: hypothetical protein VFI23_07805 [Rhizomicrobium sp.]|nr:hypothetical protein [Rhizomicrobium sp.]
MPTDPKPASTHELAHSMMRLWGRDARTMARTYALDCWRKGDAAAYMCWHSVEWHIEQALAARDHGKQIPQAYEGTVSGLQPQRTVRRRWFEMPLGAILPAIRQLGSRAMRGSGL